MNRCFGALASLLALACSGAASPVDAGSDGGGEDTSARDAAPFDAGPVLVEIFAELGAASEGIALGRTPGGAPVLYVSTLDDRIVRIAPDGVVDDFVRINGPLGIAVRDDGTLVVCAKEPEAMGGASGVFEVTADGGISTLAVTGLAGAPFALTNYVAIASDGSLVFSDSADDRVFRADADGRNVALVTDTITYPNGLAFSPDGQTLYVASWDTTTLHSLSFDAATGAYGAPSAAVSVVRNVDGVVATSTGALVLVTSTAGVTLVDPSVPSADATVLAPLRAIVLPANGVFGGSAFGVGNLYVSSLGRSTVFVVHTDLVGP